MEQRVTLRKKILVILGGPRREDLKPVHYSMALAERLGAQVFIFQLPSAAGTDSPGSECLREAVADLILSARRAGLDVTLHLAEEASEDAVAEFVEQEGIDILIFGADQAEYEQLRQRVGSRSSCEFIQVREKVRVDFL